MLFVSKMAPLNIVVQRDTTELVFSDSRQAHVPVVKVPLLIATFDTQRTLPHAARAQARDFFDAMDTDSNGDEPGPYRRSGVALDPDFSGMSYDGSDYWLRYSSFDTADAGMCPPHERHKFEAVLAQDRDACAKLGLTASPSLGKDYILVESVRLAAPWPAYDKITTTQGRGKEWVVKKIIETVRDLEVDPILVAAYEEQEQNRDYVLAGLETLREQLAAEAAEEASLAVNT